MEQPPGFSSPYDLLNTPAPNYNTQGVAVAWDAMRTFWGGVINQGWDDLNAARLSQPWQGTML